MGVPSALSGNGPFSGSCSQATKPADQVLQQLDWKFHTQDMLCGIIRIACCPLGPCLYHSYPVNFTTALVSNNSMLTCLQDE